MLRTLRINRRVFIAIAGIGAVLPLVTYATLSSRSNPNSEQLGGPRSGTMSLIFCQVVTSCGMQRPGMAVSIDSKHTERHKGLTDGSFLYKSLEKGVA